MDIGVGKLIAVPVANVSTVCADLPPDVSIADDLEQRIWMADKPKSC